MNVLSSLENLKSKVLSLNIYSKQNGRQLKILHDELFNLIKDLEPIHRYTDIVSGMGENNHYALAYKYIDDFYTGKENMLTDIQDIIQRYSEDNKLGSNK